MPVWTHIPGQFNTWRTRATTFPRWGVSLLLLAALPGILVAAAGAILLGLSILVILLLCVPAYRLILFVTPKSPNLQANPVDFQPSPGSRPVAVRIIE
jgi:hypothetical protein